jgi:hypothetical protein
MSDLKSQKIAEKFDIKNKLSIDEKTNAIVPSDDFYASTLEDVGLTLDQVKKLQKHDASLLAATTLVAGEMVAERFKADPELKEVSFEYGAGHNSYHGFFQREGTTQVRNVVEVHGMDKGELGKVHKLVKGLFEQINS